MKASRALSLWLPVVVWAAVIFAFSSIPGLSTGLGTWDTILRKAAHMAEYAILGALLLRALGRELPALFFGLGYAVTDEIHQHFVEGRHASPIDVAIDGVGVAIGIFLVRLVEARLASNPGRVA
jgi:VanZ family protein